MLAAIALSSGGLRLAVPGTVFAAAQAAVGCMIAGTLQSSLSAAEMARWPVFLFGVLAVIAASWILGHCASRLHFFPGSTAIWGISPGGATVMMILAEENGADAQLVAFMQYFRVLVVAALASILSHLLGASGAQAGGGEPWLVPGSLSGFAAALALVAAGPVLMRHTRLPAAALLFPILAGIGLGAAGVRVELPRALLAAGYALVGWRIGLRFTRPLLLHVLRQLPKVALCTGLLIALCAGIGWVLALATGIDYLSAYLATSPGGADSVAIIAASAPVDRAFVMTMQMTRLLAVMLLEPVYARIVTRRRA
jgi:membrane AbrB-like protein